MIEGGVHALQELSVYMPDIAKAATATRDSAQIWAQAAIATHDKLNIAPENFHSAQNIMASVAKNGGVSIAEQTQWLNRFAAKAGVQGTEGLAELTATMQIAMKNTAGASEAAENFDHFLKSTFSEKDGPLVRQPGRGSARIVAGTSAKRHRHHRRDDTHRADATGKK